MIRKLFFQVLYQVGLLNLFRDIHRKNGRFPILVFHRISPYHDPLWPPLTPVMFENTLLLLKKHYQIFPLEDLFILQKDQLKNACFISFDDGFEDTYTWARPLLIKHKIPATFFIPTAAIESGEIIWPLKLRNSVFFTTRKQVLFEEFGVNPLSFNSITERGVSYRRLLDYLSTLEERDFVKMLNRIVSELGHYSDEHINVVSVEQLRALSINFSIQSHTRNHLYISKLNDERVKEEYQNSIQNLESFIPGVCVKYLAYPIGDYTEKAASIASHYFDAAFCVRGKSVSIDNLEILKYRMQIPRFNIHHQSSYEVYANINGFHHFVRTLGFG